MWECEGGVSAFETVTATGGAYRFQGVSEVALCHWWHDLTGDSPIPYWPARCLLGGIGRRAALKMRFFTESRFESGRRHHVVPSTGLHLGGLQVDVSRVRACPAS